MKQILLPLFVLMISFTFLNGQFNITFELNTATIQNVDASGIYLAGGSGFGVPGDNQMLDPDGDGIYTITVSRGQGFESNYTFLNGNCPDWSCKENLFGLPCGDPANFNDRTLAPVMSDMVIKACYGTCDDDGSCTIETDSVDVTFMLNTESIAGSLDPSGIFLAGGGGFGVAGDYPMIDPDGDGIYTITVRRIKGFASNYTFLNGNCPDWSCKEDLAGLGCADEANFNDRILSPLESDMTVMACFGNCANDGTCTPNSINNLEVDQSIFKLQPTVSADQVTLYFDDNYQADNKVITVFTTTGTITSKFQSQNQSAHTLDINAFSPGLYFVSVVVNNKVYTSKFIR